MNDAVSKFVNSCTEATGQQNTILHFGQRPFNNYYRGNRRPFRGNNSNHWNRRNNGGNNNHTNFNNTNRDNRGRRAHFNNARGRNNVRFTHTDETSSENPNIPLGSNQ